MIQLMFDFASEKILVVITGSKVMFGNTGFGAVLAEIDGLKLNYEGVIREHPDLELSEDWDLEAKKRFKEEVRSMKNEEQIAEYVTNELKPHGYKLFSKQRQGFRVEKPK